MLKRAEYVFALYEGSLAEPGDANPYAGRSLALAKLWRRAYRRMLQVRVHSGPAMQRYLSAQCGGLHVGCLTRPGDTGNGD